MWMKYVKESTHPTPTKKKISTINNINFFFPQVLRQGCRLAEQPVPWCCDVTIPSNLPLGHFLLHLSQVWRDGVQLPLGSLSPWNEFLFFTIPSIQIPHWPDTGIARKLSRGHVCLILGGKDVRRTPSRDAIYQRYMWTASLTSRHFQSLPADTFCLKILENKPFLLDTSKSSSWSHLQQWGLSLWVSHSADP